MSLQGWNVIPKEHPLLSFKNVTIQDLRRKCAAVVNYFIKKERNFFDSNIIFPQEMYSSIVNYYNFSILFSIKKSEIYQLKVFLTENSSLELFHVNKLSKRKLDICGIFDMSGNLKYYYLNELTEYWCKETYKYQLIYLAFNNGIKINIKYINDNKYHICKHHGSKMYHDWVIIGSEIDAIKQFDALGYIGKVIMKNGKVIKYFADDKRWWQGPAGKILFDLMDEKTKKQFTNILQL